MTPLNLCLPSDIENEPDYMKHIMAVTTITPDLFYLFVIISKKFQNKKIQRLVTDTKEACNQFINHTFLYVPMKREILCMAQDLFILYEDSCISSSVDEKIHAWQIACIIAYHQFYGNPSFKITTYKMIAPAMDMTVHEICEELSNHVEELQSWFDIHCIVSDDEVTDIQIKINLLRYMILNAT